MELWSIGANNWVKMTIGLSQSQLSEMIAHVRAGLPYEACGLLGGLNGRVCKVFPVENVDHSSVRYTMDPTEQVRTMVAIEEAGWELLSIYHSHPNGPATPSVTDVARAYYPEVVYIILSPDERGEWRVQGFNLSEDGVVEVPFEIISA